MSNFARWDPPTITLVHNSTDASKTRRGIGSWASGVSSALSSAADAAESMAGGAVTAVETAVSAAETAAIAEADEIIDDIGDGLENLENAVTGIMEEVLDTIQDKLNEWLRDVASSLDDLDIPRQVSVHMTTYCISDAGSSNATSNETSTSTASCDKLFSFSRFSSHMLWPSASCSPILNFASRWRRFLQLNNQQRHSLWLQTR